jgi:hypothetical protein
VQFGKANFWAADPSFRLELKNLTAKPIKQISLESDIVVGLNRLNKVQDDWSIPLPLSPQKAADIQMPGQMPHPESALGWVVYPQSVIFTDGSQWTPQERGECMRIYWRDKNHQDLRILPPLEMPMQ